MLIILIYFFGAVMKFVKTSLAVALLSLGSLAAAESQITFDGAVVVNKAKGADTTVSMEDGIAGGSVWGLEGTEDLGNGYSVGFLLENGFSMDSGEAGEGGKSWSKQATLSVSGGFGELAFGRMGGLASYEGSYSIWDASPIGTDYLQAGLGNVFVTGQINNNSIVYVSPEFGGLKLHVQYSNGTEADDKKWSLNDHYYGLGLTYELGNLSLAGIVERYDYKSFRDEDTKASMIYSLSASYDFEVAKVFFGYQYASRFHTVDQLEDAFVGGKGMNQNAFTLGTEIPAAGGTLKLVANYGFGKVKSADQVTFDDNKVNLNKDKFNRFTVGAAYEYLLSKRTFLYGWGAYATAGKLFKEKAVEGDFKSWSVGLGLHHNF